MSDQEVNVKLSADVKSLLQGMKDAQEHTEKATAGMKGDLGSLIESFGALGPAALAVGAAGLAFEGLKESVDFIKEAIHETNELAESFKSLAYQTGASYEELNKLATAQALEGGSIRELEGWMKGATRSIKTNADMLVENGIAADKAALMAMPFTQYLERVMEAADGIKDPFRRGAFLTEALGKAGMEAAPNIREMLEQLKGAPEVLDHFGRKLGRENVEDMERFKRAAGEGTIAMRGFKQSFAETFGAELAKGTSQWAEFIASLTRSLPYINAVGKGLAATAVGIALPGVKLSGSSAAGAAAPGAPAGGAHETEKGEGKTVKLTSEIEAEKKAAEERVKARKAADDEIIQSLERVFQEAVKNNKELVAIGAMTEAEKAQDLRESLKLRQADQMKALADEKKILAGKPAELAAVLAKERELQQKYVSDLLEIGRQESEAKRKADEKAKADTEKARKEQLELAKLAAQDELNLQRTLLEAKEQALDADLAFGRINEAQWVAMRKAGIAQELRAQLDALDKEQKAAKDDLVAWTKIQNQKDALTRKSYGDMGKLETDSLLKSKQRWDTAFHSITSGFQSAISGLIRGTMTWGDAWKNVVASAGDAMINMLVDWGTQEAASFAKSIIDSHIAAGSKVADNAAVAGTGAAASASQNGPYGWMIAIPVGLAVMAGAKAMFSAEGGWDRVPADQIAQIHKNEMVLPAWAAEGARKTFADAASGRRPAGGDVHLHMHGEIIDRRGVETWFNRNQGAMLRTLGGAMRNGRRS